MSDKSLECLLYCGLVSRQRIRSLYICSRITRVFLHVKKMFMWEMTRNLKIRVILRKKKGRSCRTSAVTIVRMSIFSRFFFSSSAAVAAADTFDLTLDSAAAAAVLDAAAAAAAA